MSITGNMSQVTYISSKVPYSSSTLKLPKKREERIDLLTPLVDVLIRDYSFLSKKYFSVYSPSIMLGISSFRI